MCIMKQIIQSICSFRKHQTDYSIHIIGFAEEWQVLSDAAIDSIRMQIDALSAS